MGTDAHGGDPPPPSNSREDLTALVGEYVDALVANDPDAVPIAPDATFVENLARKTPGEGLWRTATAAPTGFEIHVPDPVAGQVGSLCLLKDDGDPVLLGLRLRVEDGLLTETEHLVARNLRRRGESHLDNLQTPRPAFRESVPPAERSSREELLRIGASYYDALAEDDGSLAPFAERCVRVENGMQCTCAPPPEEPGRDSLYALDCAEQLDSGAMRYISRIEPRRVAIADVETGLVCGLSQFRHAMEETVLDVEGVPGVETVARDYDPFDLPAMHVFKVRDGEIRAIEANGLRAPYDSPTGWE